jgi:subtilisin family serine protease
MLQTIKRILVSLLVLSPCTYWAQKEIQDHTYKDAYLDGILEFRIHNTYRVYCSDQHISIQALTDVFANFGLLRLKRRFPFASPPLTKFNERGERLADLSLVYTAEFQAGTNLTKLITALKKLACIDLAEPHFIPRQSIVPTDDSISRQYSLSTINAFAAWDISKGDTNTVIGITDTGFNPVHPDVGGNLKYNFSDPINGFDDDADGFIDNYRGWDTGDNDNDPSVSPGNTHGQHVTGICSAVADNSTGIAGSGYYSKFLFIKIGNSAGLLSGAYEGIVYAADHGCKIINCSWGGFQYSELNQEIIRYASINKNCLVFCGAGNYNDEHLFYPASYEYAMSVGSSDSQDRKSDFSSFGYKIDLFAPGSDILSTWSENEYILSGGTSMSAPLAAGCAAILSSLFPTWTSQQLGEQLKISADKIDASPANIQYSGKMGAGRLNMLRAFTETGKPSMVLNQIEGTDNRNNLYLPGDTIRLSGILINYLSPAQSVTLEVSSISDHLEPLNPNRNMGSFSTLQTRIIEADPLLFRIREDAPFDELCVIRIRFNADGHVQDQYVYLNVNADFINLDNNNIHTSVGSNGLIGLTGDGLIKGLGFSFRSKPDLLFEGGLLVGIPPDKVLDNVRGDNATDHDWLTHEPLKRIPPLTSSVEQYRGSATGSAESFELSFSQRVISDSSMQNKDFIILEYTIKNEGSFTVDDLYAGLFADWDLGNAAKNNAGFNASLKTGYVFTVPQDSLYTGIRILGNNQAVFHAVDNIPGGAGGIDMYDGYSGWEKYYTLSTNRLTTTAGISGTDVVSITSSGPFQVLPDSSVRIAFALLGGNSKPELEAAAQLAEIFYQTTGLPLHIKEQKQIPPFRIFPNPIDESFNVQFNTEFGSAVAVQVTDLSGRTILQQKINTPITSIETSRIPAGVYFLRIRSETAEWNQRIVVVHK